MGAAALPTCLTAAHASFPTVNLTRVALIPVRATVRSVWLFVRIHTDSGVTGLGEASDAFGYFDTTLPSNS